MMCIYAGLTNKLICLVFTLKDTKYTILFKNGWLYPILALKITNDSTELRADFDLHESDLKST